MQREKGNVIDYGTGAKKCVIPTEEEIRKSDSLRDEAWGELYEMLKNELSEDAMMEFKAAFYIGTQRYLFTGKRE